MTIFAIHGPMGVGKSTLAEAAADALNVDYIPEPFTTNPYLEGFYRDGSNVFQMQIYFLQEYIRQAKEVRAKEAYIADAPTFPGLVYVSCQRDMMMLSKDDFDTYMLFWNQIKPWMIDQRQKHVWLYKPFDEIMRNIIVRNRKGETSVTEEYVQKLLFYWELYSDQYGIEKLDMTGLDKAQTLEKFLSWTKGDIKNGIVRLA